MAVPPPAPKGYQLWYYYPSVGGNIVFATFFGIATIAHLIGVFWSKKKFCIPLIVGGLFEIIGYGFRVDCHYSITTTTPYAAQSILILLAPILFAASIYMYLGRIIIAIHGEAYSMIKPRFLTRIFVTGDVICFLIQGGGGGMLATAKSADKVKLGEHIILGGLILQIAIFVFFVAVAIIFHTRVAAAGGLTVPWQKPLLSLYIVSTLITVRNAVRAAEQGMGSSGYLLRHEWVNFVFDGTAMLLVLLITLIWYGTDVGSKLQRISTDVETYRLEPGK